MLRDKSGINKLIEIKDECLDEIELVALDDPREPIMLVNDHVLAIRNGVHNYRSHYVLPMVIGAWFFLILLTFNIGPTTAEVYAARNALEHKSVLNEEDINYFEALLGDSGNATTFDYIHAVFNYSVESHKKTIKYNLIINFIMFLVCMAITYWYLRFRIMAYLFFDRKKQIVYTWRKGRVAACRFDNIGFREETLGLRLFLYGEKKKTEDGYT
ncbi:hypothetical protein ABS858_23750, partial [Vibrio neptunius]|uniref:hypothetical protein n=1 Tax=Vibrio neptunius TaxID=170651 RepID=UPI003314E5FD